VGVVAAAYEKGGDKGNAQPGGTQYQQQRWCHCVEQFINLLVGYCTYSVRLVVLLGYY